ncbi:MAG: arginine repressor [Lachnospiraceae bacterium]|nr:arginine repressor [Lachnospiraceae bacterium]
MKNDRHEMILSLIENYEIETQEDLAQKLSDAGFSVTQATVSRDIRMLHLYKKNLGNGHQKYVAEKETDHNLNAKYKRVLKDGFVSIDIAQNILVLKTVGGMAMAVAAAVDAMEFGEVVGSIAGDDTIMMAIRTKEDAERLLVKIKEFVGE